MMIVVLGILEEIYNPFNRITPRPVQFAEIQDGGCFLPENVLLYAPQKQVFLNHGHLRGFK